jgi:hypothetical protein
MSTDCQHKVPMPEGRWFCGKPGPCSWPHCEPEHKHEAINVDNPESFKESILDVIEWTRDTIREEFRKVLNETKVTEDAGVIVPQFIQAVTQGNGVVAWTELTVSYLADHIYKARIDEAAKILALKFHVEQSQREANREHLTVYRLTIRHEYTRPV